MLRTTNLPMRILVFFLRNPDEELTIEDTILKFGVTYSAAQRALLRMSKNGILILRRESNRRSYYRLYTPYLNHLFTNP